MAKRSKSESADTLHNTNGGVDVHGSQPQPETNGTSALATEPQTSITESEQIKPAENEESPAILRYQKAPSQVFYAVMGEGRDGTVDCLGVTKTRGQAEKTLALLGMAVRRHYSSCNIWKCRLVDLD